MDYTPAEALTAVSDLVARWDPEASSQLYPELEEAMERHACLMGLMMALRHERLV